MFLEVGILLASCVVLAASGTYLVRSLGKISKFLRFEEFSVGFIIMAIATSVPEVFVGISSALAGNPALSLGNVIGSNIIALTLVGGIVVLLSKGKIKIKSKEVKNDSFFMSMIVLLPLVLFFVGGTLERMEGIFLIIVFGLYLRKKIIESKRFRKKYKGRVGRKEIVLTTMILLISLVTLFVSAEFIVNYAKIISIKLLLPPILIGLILVAIGTSLPELAFGTKASLSGHPELSLGDLIGSVIANSTLVLGVTALIHPISADLFLFLTSGFFMFIVTFLFASFIESGSRLYWKEGCSLIFLYIFFLILELYIKFIPVG